MATRSRMMDGLCLHLLSGRHSKIINKYTASFFCLCVLLSLFQNEHKDTQKIFPQQVLDHKLIHEVSMRQAHTCTHSHIQNTHLSRAMRQRFFPLPYYTRLFLWQQDPVSGTEEGKVTGSMSGLQEAVMGIVGGLSWRVWGSRGRLLCGDRFPLNAQFNAWS